MGFYKSVTIYVILLFIGAVFYKNAQANNFSLFQNFFSDNKIQTISIEPFDQSIKLDSVSLPSLGEYTYDNILKKLLKKTQKNSIQNISLRKVASTKQFTFDQRWQEAQKLQKN